ncbi:MAG: hypothetical protein GY757_44865 [bacterium]|nr:hypothetical protein [bacterium]
MIKIENLCVKKKIPGISHLELTIEAGESYVLLTAEDTATNHLLDIFSGIETLFRGRVLVDGTDILTDAGACRSRLACLGKEHGWPQDMRVKNLLSFFEKKTGITEEEHEELFITSDMEGLSAKKIGDLEETQWRRLLFFLVRLKQCKNFVIHDFAKGMP